MSSYRNKNGSLSETESQIFISGSVFYSFWRSHGSSSDSPWCFTLHCR